MIFDKPLMCCSKDLDDFIDGSINIYGWVHLRELNIFCANRGYFFLFLKHNPIIQGGH